MSNQKIDVTVNGTELTIREGKAPEIHEPKNLIVNGVLDSPLRYLHKRLKAFPETECHIIVDREKLSIKLVCNERFHVDTVITGSLQLHPDFTKLGINNGEYLTAFELADKFKMNRSLFETQNAAMEIVSKLKNFKAKVAKEIEKTTNDRGSQRLLQDQVVNSNLPENFNLNVPLFKGMGKEIIEVEVNVNPNDLSCTLISPAANDLIQYHRDLAIDSQLDQIVELAPGIVIFEV
ncbi:hypothetical protein [Albibacterium profundi]|uniref:Uncharacterized protein n=1 Tax=Albibacterium profundi TaxID=3134906 RepID=A0ABV5CI67_9SPHI